ncbi:MAG TPA: TetR/AcrR family transcriptional regulator [Pseudolysinimonas sp.]
MAGEVRERMVESAVILLAKKGVQATSFSEVLEASGAPRGSLYHHFPDGKDELIAAAVDLAGERAVRLLDGLAGLPNDEILDAFLGMWRAVLDRSRFSAGCSVLAVTVAPSSPELLEHASSVFRAWRGRLAELFAAGGMPPDAARRFATSVVAASEGAVVLSRAEQSFEPFDLVAEGLRAQLETTSRSNA